MTTLTYLEDTYLSNLEANAIDCIQDEIGNALILNQTIFYPQGGGQPSDTGTITSSDFTFEVRKVRLSKEGLVLHYGDFSAGHWISEKTVNLAIDFDKRILHAKVHSAGHLLDCAVSSLELNHLNPTKGFHFPEGPYVEYDGALENPSQWITPIEQAINSLVHSNIAIHSNSLSAELASKMGIWAPEGKSARVVTFEGFEGCGCGGTHVLSTKEIGEITIRKIKVKKGVTRIAYYLK